jgi:hypothetical protein
MADNGSNNISLYCPEVISIPKFGYPWPFPAARVNYLSPAFDTPNSNRYDLNYIIRMAIHLLSLHNAGEPFNRIAFLLQATWSSRVF